MRQVISTTPISGPYGRTQSEKYLHRTGENNRGEKSFAWFLIGGSTYVIYHMLCLLSSSPHVVTADDSVGDTEAHHEATGCGLLSVEHARVLDANIHVIVADFLPDGTKEKLAI